MAHVFSPVLYYTIAEFNLRHGLPKYTAYENIVLPVLWPFHWRFLTQIQIYWKWYVSVAPLIDIRWLQIFAHATTAMLLWHVPNFVEILDIL